VQNRQLSPFCAEAALPRNAASHASRRLNFRRGVRANAPPAKGLPALQEIPAGAF
jgi:hypothetical protein